MLSICTFHAYTYMRLWRRHSPLSRKHTLHSQLRLALWAAKRADSIKRASHIRTMMPAITLMNIKENS